MRAATVRPHEADRMRIVDHHEGFVSLGEIADRAEVRDDAVHREHAIRRDELEARGRRVLQLTLEVEHVVVRVPETLDLGEPDPVDDARVVERVADDGVLFTEKCLEETAVRVEARAVEDRIFGAEEARDPILELLVDVLRAADEADRRHAVAPAIERGMRGGQDLGIVGESEVVVRAEIDHLEIRTDGDLGPLRRADDALLLVQTALADRGDLLADRVEEALIHGRQHHGTGVPRPS